MGGFQQVDVARNQFDSKGLELAIQSMTQNLNNFYSTGTINEIGAIVAYGGTLPPTGFLLCDGSAVSRVTFSALFAVIGTTYGTGDGSTTFNLPNLKGRVPVGLDTSQTEFNTMGKTGGHKLLQAHTHVQQVASAGDNGSPYYPTISARNSYNNLGASAPTATTGGGDSQNLQPYQVVNYIIRYALPGNVSGSTNIPKVPYAFRYYQTNAENSGNGAYAKVTFDTKDFDIGNNWVSNTFTAPMAGIYHFDWKSSVTATGQTFLVVIYKNGVRYADGNLISGSGEIGSSGSTDVYLNANDTIDVYNYCSAVKALHVGSPATTYISGHIVSSI